MHNEEPERVVAQRTVQLHQSIDKTEENWLCNWPATILSFTFFLK